MFLEHLASYNGADMHKYNTLYTHRLARHVLTPESDTECCRLFQYLPFGGYCVHLPRDEFAACFKRVLRSVLYAAAAKNLHADYSYALDIVVGDNLSKLFGVVDIVELRTADYSDVILYKTLVEAAVSVRCAVCGDEQIGTVEVWGTYRDKLNLYGPLHKLTCVGIETVGSAGGGYGAAIAVGGGCI